MTRQPYPRLTGGAQSSAPGACPDLQQSSSRVQDKILRGFDQEGRATSRSLVGDAPCGGGGSPILIIDEL